MLDELLETVFMCSLDVKAVEKKSCIGVKIGELLKQLHEIRRFSHEFDKFHFTPIFNILPFHATAAVELVE